MTRLFRDASPQALFILGLLTLPAFLFQEKLLYRALDGVFFLILAIWAGKRIRPLLALLLLASVTLFALLVPNGRVVFTIMGLPVTEGAMNMGLSRGILLLGLFYLSKFTVVRGLVLPGRAGRGIARVLMYFERFTENYLLISVRDLPGSLDTLLLKVSETRAADEESAHAARGRRMPLIVPLLVSSTCWLFVFL